MSQLTSVIARAYSVRMGRERESGKRSDASRDRGSPRPGRTRVPYFWFAYRRDFRSTEVDNYRLPESGPARAETVSRGRGRGSAGPAGGAVRGRGSEPLCRPPSVEPRYNMNYLSNRNPNQPSELHCTPPRPRAVSSVEIGDTAIRSNSLSRLNIHNRYISPARSHSCARSQVSSPPHSHSSGARR